MRIPFSPKWKRTWNCLDDRRLAAFVDGTLSSAKRANAEAHFAECESCRHSVALIVRSSRETEGAVPPEWMARVRHLGEAKNSPSAAGWAWAGAMACIVIVATGMIFSSREHAPEIVTASRIPSAPPTAAPVARVEQDEMRNLVKPAPGPAVIVPAEGARVANNLEVRWQPLPNAVAYEVRVLNVAGDTIWHSRTGADHLQIPAAASLQSGNKYFVQISASLPTGKTVHARSVSFQVEANREDR